MLSYPFLTAAWWLAKATTIKAAAGRFFNAQTVAAIAVSIAVLGVTIGGVWAWKRIEAGAVAGWQAKLSTSRLVSALRDRKAQREAEARAAAEREKYVDALRATAGYAADLERQLAALTENPVCYPASITKELRK